MTITTKIRSVAYAYDVEVTGGIIKDKGGNYEVTLLHVTLERVTEDGETFVYADADAFGYHLTKAGKRHASRAFGRVYPEKYRYVGDDMQYVPTPFSTEVVYPVVRELLALHDEFKGLPVNGVVGFEA